MSLDKDLTAATAEPLVLSILAKADSYGYAIIQEIELISSERITWSEGMLYPVLHRLERQKLISSYWKKSESGRKRKYYRILKAGSKKLIDKKRQWDLAHETLMTSLDGVQNGKI